MTHRLLIACDPGMTGALALFADEFVDTVHDMPTKSREGGGNHIDERELARLLRERMAAHVGAFACGVIEQVSPRPGDGGTQAMRFGESYGVLRGVLGALGVHYTTAHPARWKRHMGLWQRDKEASRLMAVQLHPEAAHMLTRKKDHGRAEAILLGHWAQHEGAA